MKNKAKIAIAMALVAVMSSNISTVFASNESFTDIENHWAKKTIEEWQQYNIINGVGDNKYMPDSNIQRKDFAVIMYNLLGLSESEDIQLKFSDLKEGEYYSEPIKMLASTGILNVSNDKIRPFDLVTREEAASILCKALNIGTSTEEIKAVDADTIDSWAAPYISALINEGCMKGDTLGKINPKANITRAEALVLISNITGNYITDDIIINIDRDTITTISDTVKIEDSAIRSKANILLNNKLEIVESTIKGLKVSSDIINITKSNIDKLEVIKSNTVINSDSHIKEIIIGGTNVVINDRGTFDKLVMKPYSSISYNESKVKNNSSIEMIYTPDTIQSELANSISLNAKLSYDNSLTASIKANESEGIAESGIIYNKSLVVPTLKKNDGKGSILNIQLKNNEDIIMRGYCIDSANNKVYYTDAKVLRGFDFKLGMKMKSTEAIRSNGKLQGIKKTVQFILKGTNIPDIASISMISSTDNILGINKNESTVKLVEDKSKLSNTEKIFESQIKFDVNESGVVLLDRFYGYKIEFTEGNDTYEAFPIIEDSTIPEHYISDINTGEAKFIGNRLDIKGNTYKSSGSIIEETGVVYKVQKYSDIEPDAINNDWDYIKSVDSIDNSVSIELGDTYDSKIYYAFYVRTNTGKSYGPIRQIVGKTEPILTGNQSINVNNSKDIASIKIGIDTSSGIDLKNSKIHSVSEDNKNMEKYTEIGLDKLDSKYSNGVLQIILSGLREGRDYKMSLLVSNETGILDNITIQFSTK